MYTYQEATCLSYDFGYNWESADISEKPLSTIYGTYQQVFVTVHDLVIDKIRHINMDTYRSDLCASPKTIVQWLETMANKPIEFADSLPTDNLVTARYENAVLMGYKIEPSRTGYHVPDELPSVNLIDLSITRSDPRTDITLLHTHALISVNGFFHRTDTDGLATYVIDGAETAFKRRCAHTGILSFANIGKITQYQIKDDDIMPLSPDGKLKDGLIIKIPEEYQEFSSIFILGGYIIRPDKEAFYKNAENTWILQVKALPYVERYFESKNEIDLSSIKVDAPLDNKDDAVLVEDLYNDDNIRAWLKLSQSFIAFVDTPILYYDQINVRVSTLPGLITAYQEPKETLIMGYGKSVEYSKVQEAQFWALRVQDPFYKQFAFSNAPARVQPVMSNHLLPWKQYQRTQGYLLKISGERKAT